MPLRRGGNGSGMDGLVDGWIDEEAGPMCGDSGVGSGRIWASVFIDDRFFGDESGNKRADGVQLFWG